jgi:hypothetical protein
MIFLRIAGRRILMPLQIARHIEEGLIDGIDVKIRFADIVEIDAVDEEPRSPDTVDICGIAMMRPGIPLGTS